VDKRPVCNCGSAAHCPFSVADGVSTSHQHRDSATCLYYNGAKETADNFAF